MWTGSWLAYGEILRNSADSAVRFLNKATTRPDVVRIATTGKGLTIGIMGRSVTTGTTGRGVTTMTTNKGKIDCTCVANARRDWRFHSVSRKTRRTTDVPMPSCLPIPRMLARRRALPLPEFSGAPADRIVDPVERDQPGVQQVQVAVEAIPLLSFFTLRCLPPRPAAWRRIDPSSSPSASLAAHRSRVFSARACGELSRTAGSPKRSRVQTLARSATWASTLSVRFVHTAFPKPSDSVLHD
jgi:hypothetical protein